MVTVVVIIVVVALSVTGRMAKVDIRVAIGREIATALAVIAAEQLGNLKIHHLKLASKALIVAIDIDKGSIKFEAFIA